MIDCRHNETKGNKVKTDTLAREALAEVRKGKSTRTAARMFPFVTVSAIHAAASCQQGDNCTGPGCRL